MSLRVHTLALAAGLPGGEDPQQRVASRLGVPVAVQARRLFPARATQAVQVFLQNRIIAPTLASGGVIEVPFIVRLLQWFPVLQRVPARAIALGVRPEHVHTKPA